MDKEMQFCMKGKIGCLEAFRKYYHEEIPDYRSLYGGTSLGYYDTYHPEDGDFPPEK